MIESSLQYAQGSHFYHDEIDIVCCIVQTKGAPKGTTNLHGNILLVRRFTILQIPMFMNKVKVSHSGKL